MLEGFTNRYGEQDTNFESVLKPGLRMFQRDVSGNTTQAVQLRAALNDAVKKAQISTLRRVRSVHR